MKNSNGRRSSMLSGVGDARSQQQGTAAVRRSHLHAPGHRRTTLGWFQLKRDNRVTGLEGSSYCLAESLLCQFLQQM